MNPVAQSIVSLAVGSLVAVGTGRPNVLFIAVDDLRPQTAAYGRSFMRTPNLDRLAAQGVLFERAYCMVPTCGASRAALMTGLRPARHRFVNHLTWAEQDAPGVPTLNTHFKVHGYTTISLGKVFHHRTDEAAGWSEPAWRPNAGHYRDPAAVAKAIADDTARYPGKREHRGPPVEAFDASDDAYPDGQISDRALAELERLGGPSRPPFFLAVGFMKPHLPFTAPRKYWDLYDAAAIQLPANDHPPKDAPAGAVHNSGELRPYAGIPPQGPVDAATARRLIHGYYACVSFIDAQVGRLLDGLERLGLATNTVVVLWGDHGWQLGEHGMWNKHSCFETSMHAPLLVTAPHLDSVKPGTRVRALTEFIDVYPSLCELVGLPLPAHLEGRSFVPLMRDPGLPGKDFAIGRFGAGDTVRTERYRYSEYTRPAGGLTGRMLYDHRIDPGENVNVAADAPAVTDRLAETLNANKGR